MWVAKKYIQEETAEVSWTHNDERGFGEFHTHIIYWEQEEQGKAASHLPDKVVWMDCEMGSGRLVKRTNVAKDYEG